MQDRQIDFPIVSHNGARMSSLGTRTFSLSDQQYFADLTCDRNPMHLDILFARRTQPGYPVVHGMHLFCWALELFAADAVGPYSDIACRFSKFVLVNELAELIRTDRGDQVVLDIRVSGEVRARFTVLSGQGKAQGLHSEDESLSYTAAPLVPVELEFDQMEGMRGCLALADSVIKLESAFPLAARLIGKQRLAAIAETTTVVGMLCPGLHSFYAEAKFSLGSYTETKTPELFFEVVEADDRYRVVRITVSGPGVQGELKSFVRTPPVSQASCLDLSTLVGPDEFAGSVSLVVGGSRGLGELTAKILATGGGNVILTYHSGKDDADAVVADIVSHGGKAKAIRYDATAEVAEQLAGLAGQPTHLFYFATSSIFRNQSEIFSQERFANFLDFYVDGFWRLLKFLRAESPTIFAFYPSSISVESRPKGMTEYTMAKAAGEVLCEDMIRHLAPTRIKVSRLPRMLTDQTATVTPVETESAISVLLPILRSMFA
jgi:acyl dehydratase/NADP-dependent 3-hydroxy acid dehydrogenase YdfG